jgi:hypothetical protein
MTKARDIADFKFENIVDTGTEGTKVASGTTAQRGSTTGQWRFNSTTGFFEGRGASDFLTLEPTPTVTSVDVTEVESGAGGNQTFVITGTNFTSGGVIAFVGSSAQFNASTTTFDNATQVTAVAPKVSFLNAQEPYKIKFTSASGVAGVSATGLINVDNAPSWTTSAGSLGSISENATGNHFTVVASDPDGDTVSYSLQSGSLAGLSLDSSTGVISGDPTDVSSDTTNSFTLRATAGSKNSDRAFTYITTNVPALPSDISSWTYPVNRTHSGGFNNSDYYGYGFHVENGDGTINQGYGSYEYPIFSKYSIRSSVNEDVILQLYNLSSYTSGTNLLQFGAIWVDPTNMAQTNTLMAKTDLSNGDGVYLVNGGYGNSLTTGFFTGGSNHNASGQGGTNRESQSSVSYTNNTISLVIKKDTGTNARKIAFYTGDTKIYTYTAQIPSSTPNIYWYFGHGYSGSSTIINNLTPKLRYSASTSYDFTV